jgi:hypothetical protein
MPKVLNGIPEDSQEGLNMYDTLNTLVIHESVLCWLNYLTGF